MTWEFDNKHAYIGFTGRHLMVATVRGEFERYNVKVNFDENNITAATAEVEIEAASVNTRNADRDAHFRSADFFEVATYPYITFKSTRVELKDPNHGLLIGDLTIRGITREVALDMEFSGVSQSPWNTLSAGFSLRGKVNRKDWGLNWNAVLAGGGLVASDEINLVIDLELTKLAVPAPVVAQV